MFSGFGFLESAVLLYLGVLAVLACLIAWWARGDDRPVDPPRYHSVGPDPRRRK